MPQNATVQIFVKIFNPATHSADKVTMARILVVDDDPDILRVVEKVLKMANHDVSCAYDAMKAMDLLNSSLFDLLITDANMPRFSGFELARTLKNNKRFHKMAVCMLTGLREKKDIERAIRAGVDDYIVKPIDPMLLLQKIENIFIKRPPVDIVSFNLPDGAYYSNGQLSHAVSISQISEDGMLIKTTQHLSEGLTVQVGTELFKKMDVKPPAQMRVISCHKTANGEFEARIAFLGTTENTHEKIRTWILEQNTKRKSVA